MAVIYIKYAENLLEYNFINVTGSSKTVDSFTMKLLVLSNSLLEKSEGKCQMDFWEVVAFGGNESLGYTYCVKVVRQQIAQFFSIISVSCHIYMHLIYVSQLCFKAESKIYYSQFFINMYVAFSSLCKLLLCLKSQVFLITVGQCLHCL
jgi:hypothetical protein